MFGMGIIELLIIIAILVVLFGAPVLTFLLGYSVGRRSSRSEAEIAPAEPAAHLPESSDSEEPDHE
jgi:Sec-independent protein translocase protein TatA